VSCWARPVFAGENARFEFIVRGAGTGGTGIGFAFDKEKEILRNIETGRDNRVDVHAPASTRGRLTPGPLLIFSNYPLGLFHARSRLYIDLSCLVYPKPLAQVANSISEIFSAQGENGNYGSGVDDFQGLRGYVPGDPLQRISWRASSRGQGLFTKEFAGQHGSAVFLDWNRLTASGRERKLSSLCAMVLEAQQTQIKYGLKLPGKTIEPDNGEVHRNRCLKALALFPLK
jgi:uncharacterized protein (DUF58 family)